MNSMKDCVLVLNIDKERLKSAPTFDRAKWPDLANATSWARDLDQYYASDMRSTTGRPIEAGARLGTASFKATDLKDKNVESTTGDKIGEIKDFVLDPNSGRVALVVLSVGGFLGMGEHHVAVPFEALHVTKGDTAGKEKFTLSTTKERLTSAPEFKTGQEHWTEMSDPAYVNRVYDYYSIRPYWNMSGSTGGMDDGSGSGGGGGG